MATPAAARPVISRTRSATMNGTAPKVGTLLVQGPHRKGIVSSLGQVLSRYGATIVDSNHHSDPSKGMFFQRIRFDLSTLSTDRVTFECVLRELGEQYGLGWRVWYGERKRRVALFASKQEHCLYDLLIRHRAGELACDIAMIISNHPDAGSIARHFGVTFHHLPVTKETKQQQEAAAAELIDGSGIDLIVLARYMQILSPTFVARYPSRIINIHHSFLPSFVGADPYRQAHEKGVKMIGATSHYVTAELDQGPIIEQSTVRCAHRDTVEDLVRKGRDLEKNVLAAAVRWHLDDRVMINGGRTVVFD
ncbi:MAG: formyltetrahydrofolate deformylase [Deltaproteobacteria bacterium]|nr:formyltetrahydrofolate deformylase [Deltaproteobacteria bacterium]